MDDAKRQNVPLDDFQSLLDFIRADGQLGLKSIAEEAVRLIKMILTTPVSTCTAERSYSGLRRLKTYLRSTMTQERLNAVSMMNTHCDIARQLKLDKLLDDFIKKAPIRLKTFALS